MKSLPLCFLTTTLLIISIESAIAGSETSPATTPSSPNTPESSLPAIGSTSTLSQQAGVIQNNSGWGGFGSAPNCAGACVFANVRVLPNGNANSIEATIGFVWQISSPEQAQAQANRAKTDAEREQLTAQTDLSLSEKLADAIERQQPERVNAIAMILAKRLGYSDYHQYLRDIRRVDRIGMMIDVPINY